MYNCTMGEPTWGQVPIVKIIQATTPRMKVIFEISQLNVR